MTTSLGAFTLELDPERAPLTVENFLAYVDADFYAGTVFHRVIEGFMIQGGGMGPGLARRETRPPIRNEAGNGLQNRVGSIAMARTSDPHSATSQFFINVADNDFLDRESPRGDGNGYCVFGMVTEGLDVVQAIADVTTGTRHGMRDVPVDDVIIERVERMD